MTRTIAIIAPMFDEKQYHLDFNLRLRKDNRELTLGALYELAKNAYQPQLIAKHENPRTETIPSAGYYLTGLLRANGYDTILGSTCDNEFLSRLSSADPFAICISSTMIVDNAYLKKNVRQIRQFLPEAFIIVGGVFVYKSFYTLQEMQNTDVEVSHNASWMLFNSGDSEMDVDIFVVAPDGTQTLLMVLKELERGRKAQFEHIPNLAIADHKGGYTFTPSQNEEIDYNKNFTRWDLVDKLPMWIPIRSSIGCPFRCRFCNFYRLFPKIFLRSKESLLLELQTLRKQAGGKSRIIHVTDDNVFINEKRAEDVCEAFTEANISWVGFMRASTINPENINLIKRSGLIGSLVGVESGDAAQLKRMNKHQTPEETRQGIELLDHNGITVLMTFVVGFPGETVATIENTANFINSLSIGASSSNYQLYPLSIFPLSDLAKPDFRKKWKITGHMDSWSHYTMNSHEAVEYGYNLFKQIANVPYNYSEESNFFNSRLFTYDQRQTLFNLRQKLTVQLLEHSSWERIAATLVDISQTMGFSQKNVDEKFRHELVVPAIRE
jgi:p-methyltransferase